METRVLVVGAGPGGYVAAIRLGQLGIPVLLADKDALGGECLNYGCIPSKALIAAAGLAHKARKAAEIGIGAGELRVDMGRVQQWKTGLVQGFRRGIAGLSKGNGVQVLQAEARLTGPRSAELRTAAGTESLSFEHCILATGSRPLELPGLRIDGRRVLGNKEMLELGEIPVRLAVVGGGVIGLEIGTYCAKLGSRVTVIEALPQVLAGLDPELTGPVLRSLQKLGVEILLNAKAKGHEEKGGGIELLVETPEGERRVPADRVLLSVGRAPVTTGLGLETAGVRVDAKGFVPVDAGYRSSVPSIHAVGDLVGPPFLAHKASREGLLAASAIAGEKPEPLGPVPWAVFTDPEISSVGETEAQLQARGAEYSAGRFPFSASGRAQAGRESEGFVKVLAEKGTGKLLGVGIVGPSASDLISEACLALRLGATVHDVASTIHPHPTLPEAFQEACEAAVGRAIHVPASARR